MMKIKKENIWYIYAQIVCMERKCQELENFGIGKTE